MNYFNLDHLELVEDFFPAMDTALFAAARARNERHITPVNWTPVQWIHRESSTEDFWRPYQRSRSEGERLTLRVFTHLVTKFLRGNVSEEIIAALELKYEAYQAWNRGCSEKTNPSWPTVSLSGKNIDLHFERILSELGCTEAMIFEAPKPFFGLLDASVDQPACTGHVGKAITNGEAVCRFMKRHRSRLQFKHHITDDLWDGYLASAAWWGGWAAQQVGQTRKLDWFLSVAKHASGANGWMASVAANTLQFYRASGERNGRSSPSDAYAQEAHDIFFSNRRGAFDHVAPEFLGEIHLNPVRELVSRGGSLEDKPSGLNISGRDLLERSRKAKPAGTYSVLSNPLSDLTEAEAALNSKKPDAATVILRRVELALLQAPPKSLDFLSWRYEFVRGKTEEMNTESRNNPYIQRALLTAIEARSLPDALQIRRYLAKK